MLLFASLLNCLKCFILFALIEEVYSDYYSSIVGLEKLIDMEEKIVTAVEKYISSVHNRYKKIQSFLEKIELEHKRMKNDSSYILQPVNSFKVIKRFVIDWKEYDEIIDMTTAVNDFNKTISNLMSNYIQPTKRDLNGTVSGLLRLQNVYQLDARDISKGYIFDHKYSENLKAHDCYIMGVYLFKSRKYSRASEWFVQALQQLNNAPAENEYPFLSKLDVLLYLPIALYYCGNIKLANIMNMQLLHLDPENRAGLYNKDFFKKAVLKDRRSTKLRKQTKTSKYNTLYHQLCRGEVIRAATKLRSLHCRYVTNNVPFYFIGPLKMEKLNHDPFVALYHQTIYDNEIKYIMNWVANKVVRSTVGESKISDIRTSKQTWLQWNKHKFMAKVYQRLEDVTGLDLKTGDSMQVANYGIGGHYEPHYDFRAPPAKLFHKYGNRILTAMFYINDVQLGGSTVFPFLRVAVPPTKYSLLMWDNMHESTEFDYRTKHAGCPVLKGSKWICNEWFRVVGQEFKRPCGLQTVGDKYEYLKDILLTTT